MTWKKIDQKHFKINIWSLILSLQFGVMKKMMVEIIGEEKKRRTKKKEQIKMP